MGRIILAVVVALAASAAESSAQGRGQGAGPGGGPGAGRPGGPPPTAKAAAPYDLTGYWVSMVTDDWRYRMLTPPKGNADYLPVNAEARRVMNLWDPADDEAKGEQCRSYGAVGVMRLPGRLNVSWESDTVLRLDTDAGTQSRRFVFGAPDAGAATAAAAPTWQGTSAARWVVPGTGQGGPDRYGQLNVTTTRMRPGYIRKNGIPYSAAATLTEYFVRLKDDDGQEYLAVTQTLDDAQYLVQPIIRTMLFKKQRDASGWNPSACSSR